MANTANSPTDQISMTLPYPGHLSQSVTVTVTAAEAFSTTDPTDVAVLLFWKCVEAAGQEPTAESVWRHMADLGIREGDQIIRRETVREAVDNLAASGLVSQGGESSGR